MSIVKINEVELEVDFLDPDFVERYENAHEQMNGRFRELRNKTQGMKESQALRLTCEISREFLDEIFGGGTSERIFGKKMNAAACMEAIEAVVDESFKQRAELNNISNRFMQRHYGNREQRRNSKKNKKGNQQQTITVTKQTDE